MGSWFFVSDLHGRVERYLQLFACVQQERPAAVLLGGDLLPKVYRRRWTQPPAAAAAAAGEGPLRARDGAPGGAPRGAPGGVPGGVAGAAPDEPANFLDDFLLPELRRLSSALGRDYPRVLVILGNDDPRCEEETVLAGAAEGLWEYAHGRKVLVGDVPLYGYACIPPSPFMLKDWERYDVSRHVDPGCVSPEEGRRSVPVDEREIRYGTIAEDLARLTGEDDLADAVCLFHCPPYRTQLDRAALDGKTIDHVPLDVNIGSIAIRRFIEERRPRLTLHGHVHESARLTGVWREQLGRTHALSAAHDGPELALVRFDLADLARATRELLPPR